MTVRKGDLQFPSPADRALIRGARAQQPGATTPVARDTAGPGEKVDDTLAGANALRASSLTGGPGHADFLQAQIMRTEMAAATQQAQYQELQIIADTNHSMARTLRGHIDHLARQDGVQPASAIVAPGVAVTHGNGVVTVAGADGSELSLAQARRHPIESKWIWPPQGISPVTADKIAKLQEGLAQIDGSYTGGSMGCVGGPLPVHRMQQNPALMDAINQVLSGGNISGGPTQ